MPAPSEKGAAAEQDRFGVTPPSISLPKGGGAIRGIGEKFSANPVTGTGSMSVPIATSPGRSGFGPQLALSYDSGAGNGPFGLGWHLSLPAITRKTDKGLPTYIDAAESDVFILAGAEDLVPLLVETAANWRRETQLIQVGPAEYRISTYRPRIEGLFARIERWARTDGLDTFWRTISRDNVTTFYGKTLDSRIVDPFDSTRIFSWLICETHDDKGNVALYEYQRENRANVLAAQSHERNRPAAPPTANVYIKRIKYGNTPSRLHPDYQDLSKRTWHFEVVFDYDEGHYDEQLPDGDGRVFANASPEIAPDTHWPVRMDPFSSYRSGFEVRTYRLCRRVLMFHRFAELGADPVLVKSTDFGYAPGESATFMRSVTHSAYARIGGNLLKRSFPPVDFTYSPSPSAQDLAAQEIEDAAPESVKNLPVGLATPYQWIDLDGEGLSGVLSEEPGAWYYKRNLGEGRFGPMEVVASRPTLADRGTHQFMDLAGDGHLDVVVADAQLAGLAERTADDDWEPFRPFVSAPNVSWRDPNVRFLDLTGDGLADLMVSEDEAFVWYPSLGEEGFGPAQRVAKLLDEEKGPHLVFADETQTIFLADMSGDGLTDLVRIRNGEVSYWPNLGYGRFGARTTMDRSPWFDHPDRFDPKRIRLSDIDGSGVVDIVYLHSTAPVLYFNQSGNSWSNGRALPQFPRVDDLSSVQVIDLLGRGTACLVWSSSLPGDAVRPLRYVDLMGGIKPHLLVQVNNNLGATTTLEYASSTRFYLEDRAAGRPWVTRLPFPVHVVARTTVEDKWRHTKFSSTFSYHHGHFDGEEREFRGFGRVEQVDVEDYGRFAAGNIDSPYITQDRTLYQPPVKTITWFHTGAAIDRQRILTQFQGEYFPNAFAGFPPTASIDQIFREKALPEPDLVSLNLTGGEWREALRACKGMTLRQEVYELDVEALQPASAKPVEHIPVRLFSAATHNCGIRLVQPRGDNQHAVFLVTESEAISYHYELDLRPSTLAPVLKPDPRIAHTLNLSFDELGNVQQSVSVGYPRTRSHEDATLDQGQIALVHEVQLERHLAYVETHYTNDVPDHADPPPSPPLEHYRLRMPFEVQTYELTGFSPAREFYFDLSEVRTYGLSETLPHQGPKVVTRKQYHQLPQNSSATMRLVEHAQTLFFKDDLSGPLAIGKLGTLGLTYEHYKLALTTPLLDAIFTDGQLEDLAPDGLAVRAKLGNRLISGYLNAADGYWMRSGVGGFAADAARHFYLPQSYTDAFDKPTTLSYDAYDLLLRSSTDAVGNRTAVERFDYRVLAPATLVDVNANHTEAYFDVLGRVIAVALEGKGSQGDDLVGYDGAVANPVLSQVLGHFDLAPLTALQALNQFGPILGRATGRYLYHFGEGRDAAGNPTWLDRPAGACAIVREQHVASLSPGGPPSPLQIAFECSDGMGTVLMKRSQAEPEHALGPLRWIVSGKTVLNNKGKPVKQYEPYFSVRAGCCAEGDEHEEVGVTSLMYYDAAGRLVRTEMPDGTFSRVEFSPWHAKTFDQNDTVKESRWYRERLTGVERGVPLHGPDASAVVIADAEAAEALAKKADAQSKRAAQLAALHAGTPAQTILDSLGRAVIAIADLGVPDADGHSKYLTFTKLDAEGKPLWVRDAHGHLVMQYITPPKANDDPSDAMPPLKVPCYDIAGNLLYQHSMDAGDRWMLTDAAGKPMLAWDFNDRKLDNGTTVAEHRQFHTRYDVLHRPVEHWLTINKEPAALIEAFTYVDHDSFKSAAGVMNQAALTAVQTRNVIGQAITHYDPSGLATVERVDFKGAAEEITRTLVDDVEAPIVDWNVADRAALLDRDDQSHLETFRQITEHDALGRVSTLYNWHRDVVATPGYSDRVAVYVPQYSERGLLLSETLHVQARKTTTGGKVDFEPHLSPSKNPKAIREIIWNAKGQKTSLALGNGTVTRYTYDPDTFRLVRLYTRRDTSFAADCGSEPPPPRTAAPDTDTPPRSCGVQNLRYTYDPVGNITHIQDDAQQTIWFANVQVEPSSDYTYDALYRLIEATGRENAVAVGAPPHPEGPWPTGTFASAADTRRYTQRYRYDSVGNIVTMQHIAPNSPLGPDGSWTRDYAYAFDDPTQPASNRLWQTWEGGNRLDAVTYRHDPHGSMLNLAKTKPGLDVRWDWRDMIRALDLQGGGDAFYNYGIDKQRTRKRLVRNDNSSEDRLYLGGYELYRRRNPQDEVIEEIESLHLFEGEQRVLLVDDVVVPPLPQRTLFRYQYSNYLGSVGVELDETAKVISYEEFHPYGTTAYRLMNFAIEAPAKRYRYTGMERDEETGLNYHGARYYAPRLGRWAGCDPLQVAAGINLFQYCHDEPIGHSDKSGLAEAVPTIAGLPFESDVYAPPRGTFTSVLTTVTEEATGLEGGLKTSFTAEFGRLVLNTAENPWAGTGKAPGLMGLLMQHNLGLHKILPNQIQTIMLDSVIEARTIAAVQQGTPYQQTFIHGWVQRAAARLGLSLELKAEPQLAPNPPGAKFFGPFLPQVEYTATTVKASAPLVTPQSPATVAEDVRVTEPAALLDEALTSTRSATAGSSIATAAEAASPATETVSAFTEASFYAGQALRFAGRAISLFGADKVTRDFVRTRPDAGTLANVAVFWEAAAAGFVDDALFATGIGQPIVVDYWNNFGAGPAQVAVRDFNIWLGAP